MTEKLVLVTGACGEIGQALVQGLSQKGGYRIITSDLTPLPDSIKPISAEHVQGDLVYKVKNFYDYDFDVIFHLAASLSSKAEIASEEAHRINVEGTMQLLMLAAYRSEKYCNTPHTMYGCNKLYCEKLGMYYSKYFGQKHLDDIPPHMLDFRAIRFPDLISAFTLPSDGTSDYGPEMLHADAQGKPYACFVREDTKISFMAMPDAIKSLLMLVDVPREKLNHQVYNIAAFALTAGEFRDRAVKAFPGAQITFAPNPRRQGIVDSWPEDVDDTLARTEWNWRPDYSADAFFDDYFLPEIRKRYGK